MIALDFVIKNANLAEPGTYNEYITHFSGSPWVSSIRDVCRVDYSVKQLMNHKSLKKEITETMGALCLAEQAARRLEDSDISIAGSPLILLTRLRQLGQRLTIYDVCSGKGLSSFFATFFLPEARIVMIDFNAKIRLDHLKNPICTNISYEHMDIYKQTFYDFLLEDSKILPDNVGGISIVLGLHLCGTLSTRLTQIYNSISSLSILVLSPCCMPKKGKRDGDMVFRFARPSKVNPDRSSMENYFLCDNEYIAFVKFATH
eukprot:gene2220-4315_t